MHICIIGTGSSGLIACAMLRTLEFIKKITIIGSNKIPSIGVGESTTLNFTSQFLKDLNSLDEFVHESDATVKYGVYYKNWSKRDYIHSFQSGGMWEKKYGIKYEDYAKLLGNKPEEVHIHDLMNNKLWNFIKKNEVSFDKEEYPHSWHFDAGKFITFLKNKNLKDERVNYIDDKIIDCKFSEEEVIEYVVGESNTKYTADYFINCCGDSELNERVFKEQYIPLSPYLLTNKALVYPLEYTNKREQFHPYTVAKTMKNGWRWITPTQSRIGTGYVFSDKHISVDEARNEFLEDIGDKSIEPFLVDFNPKYNKKAFKINNCTIGMSSGFLEPLDAPGLCLSIGSIFVLKKMFTKFSNTTDLTLREEIIKSLNYSSERHTMMWASFILHQYKTCWRNDTKFWQDHKSVQSNLYDEFLERFLVNLENFSFGETMMFSFTKSAKDINWESKTKEKPFHLEQLESKTIHHLDYISSFSD